MSACYRAFLSRRAFLAASGAAAAVSVLRPWRAPAGASADFRLVAGPGRTHLVGATYPETAVWSYNGTVPGPEIRVRQGQRLRIAVESQLAEETTVHWHGLRVPNPMDGVPHLTQPPIAPGETFVYEFDVPDAGTYWYHPHQRSFEQVGRGLYGPLIVEERERVQVDRDVTWVLDDWRLLPDARISDDFGNFMDKSHNGRIGNTVTVNGRILETFAVRAGERVRLRLINAANARIFGLEFQGHRPTVIALDGQPVEPHGPAGGRVVLGPAMRADLVIDMAGKPGERFTVADTFYRGLEYRLLDLVYGDEPPLRPHPLDAPLRLAANTMPEPDLSAAERHEIEFGGGMMGAMANGGGMMGGMMRAMQPSGIWSINGVSASDHVVKPFLALRRGRPVVLAMHNHTAWHHPMHLHGHSFRVIARDGRPTSYREWQDTVLMAPHESVEIAFVADNPGDWMFHCHILEHQAAGMMGVIRVT
ncbi:MAG TPA: multicopper oxidase family protein [Geminicoccaceae bacterium]|nr:multicopper oxidase family protein [Geminicoccaceae bacterium]